MAEQLAFDILAKDVNASRTFKKVGDAAGDAGDEFKGMAKDSELLGKQIEDTEHHLTELRKEFARTGDASLKKLIGANERDLAFLNKVKKGIGEVTEEAADVGKKAGKQVTSGFSDALQSLPAQVKGAGMLGIAGLAVSLSPVLGSIIGGAVLGGVGMGGIVGGVALAAQDDRVKQAASKVGENLMAGLQSSAKPFVAPLVDALNTLDTSASSFTADLGAGFRALAPVVKPLAEGIQGLQRNLGPGLVKAFQAAEPAVRAIARELPEVGDAIGDMLTSIADEGDGATEALIGFLNVLEAGIRATGEVVGGLSATFEWLVKVEGKILDIAEEIPIFGLLAPFLHEGSEGAKILGSDLDAAKDSSHDFAGSMTDAADATNAARVAMTDYAKALQDQFDPTANLIHRLQDVKEAQKEYSEAVKEHGRKSQEAKDAELKLAEAILAANSAALTAEGTFDGHLTPAMKATLRAGGMTEKQIRDIEKAFIAAHKAGQTYEDVYKAKALLEFASYRADERNPAGKRASGGAVQKGKTYLVGENGPELVTFGDSGYVHNASDTQAMMTGASGGSAGGAWGASPIFLTLAIEATGDPLIDALIRELRKHIRIYGGGNVQVALGNS